MFRLAHISDIHLGPLPKVSRSKLFSKRITGYINFRRNRSNVDQPEITKALVKHLKSLGPDHTAITGDLINLGLEEEIENAANWLMKLGEPDRNSVVLGNHDAYVRGARGKAMAAWQPYVTGDDMRTIKSDKDYPVLRRRGDISLIGCNSARASAPFLATGYFKKDQSKKLEEVLRKEGREGKCRVVMIHHAPFPNATDRHKRLMGMSNFLRAIKSAGAELILHGHTHLATLESIPGPDGKVPVVCVPAAYQWTGHRKPPAAINLFEISKRNQGWHIELQRHSLTENADIPFASSQTRVILGSDLPGAP